MSRNADKNPSFSALFTVVSPQIYSHDITLGFLDGSAQRLCLNGYSNLRQSWHCGLSPSQRTSSTRMGLHEHLAGHGLLLEAPVKTPECVREH